MASAVETLVVVRTDHSFKSRVSEHVANHHSGAVSEAGSLQKGLLYTLRPETTPPAFVEAFAADKVMASVVSSVLLCNESAVALAGVAARAAALVAELELELAEEQQAGGGGGGGGSFSRAELTRWVRELSPEDARQVRELLLSELHSDS